ncbi:MAG: extracellular solute-binding protein [Ardenticatenaceae bacterium]|nr:extracellular solute-binding protein [Ardenticatenaceae bacterium]
MKKYRLIFSILTIALLALAACQPQIVEVTRVVTETETVTEEVTRVVTETETVSEEVEVTRVVEVEGEAAQTITFWTTEVQPARAERQQAIIDAFTAETGIEVVMVLVEENDIDSVMAANFAAGTLPDVTVVPLDFTAGWEADGILDPAAAGRVLDTLGRDTFSEGALELLDNGSGPVAVPADGWGQFIAYRADLFEELGLEAPDTFETIRAAAEALDAAGYIGIMSGTDPGQTYTQQTFEHFAMANGATLTDADGNVTMNTPEMIEALDFYSSLMAEAGPKDTATFWDQARALYFAGEVGMTVWSPFLLDEMAGLRDSAFPNCDECADDPAFIAKNTEFATAISGPSGAPAQYGAIFSIGITSGANTDAAETFLAYWLGDEAYVGWLGVAPEGKFPMRRGTADNPTQFIEEWAQLEVGVDRKAPLTDFYSPETLEGLVQGANNIDRWGFDAGQGQLVSAVYSELVIPQAIADIIDGFLTPEEAAEQLQEQVEEIQAGLIDDS